MITRALAFLFAFFISFSYSQLFADKSSQVQASYQEEVIQKRQNSNSRVPSPSGKTEQTLTIIKPDGVQNRHIGDIISRFEKNGLRLVAIKMSNLTKDQAAKFYQVHHDLPFYNELVNFMSSGPVVIIVLEGPDAISKSRKLMGATNPQKADPGTIRADFAETISRNAIHGSDSPEAAAQEIHFFFAPEELVKY